MSLRTGITRLYDFTADDAYRISQIIRDAIKAIWFLRNWWKSADPFKRYRLVQVPIEASPWVPLFYLNTIIVSIRPVLDISSIGIGILVVIPFLVWIGKGQSTVLRRLRERWILPIPIMAFVCVRCRHGAICHVGHPSRKCPHCKLRWKDEWADYWKFPPTIEMRIDDVNPGITW